MSQGLLLIATSSLSHTKRNAPGGGGGRWVGSWPLENRLLSFGVAYTNTKYIFFPFLFFRATLAPLTNWLMENSSASPIAVWGERKHTKQFCSIFPFKRKFRGKKIKIVFPALRAGVARLPWKKRWEGVFLLIFEWPILVIQVRLLFNQSNETEVRNVHCFDFGDNNLFIEREKKKK